MPTTQALDRILRILLAVTAGLLVLLLVLTVVFFATKGLPAGDTDPTVTTTGGDLPADTDPDPDGVTLPKTSDAGVAYQDKIIFVGDSLTAHLINRGVLTGGTATKQVWRCENNMLNLDSKVTQAKIVYPATGELMTIAEAAKKAKPEIMIITLGTDYGVSYLNEADFKACYTKLVKAVQAASPSTKIILQSIFPVTASCTSLQNDKIDAANVWVKAVAAENHCYYLDTQSVLKDNNNCLKTEYCNSNDGIHLTKGAYEVILHYIRTHAVAN